MTITMDAEEVILILKNQPSREQLSSLCKKVKPQVFSPSPSTQRILACLLSETLPELETVSPVVVDLFGSLPGISAILFNIKNLIQYFETSDSASANDSNELIREHKTKYTSVNQVKLSIRTQVEFLLVLLSKVLKTTTLDTIYKRATHRMQYNELNAIFAGSSLYSLVSQTHMVLDQHTSTTISTDSWHWISEKELYGSFLARSTLTLNGTEASNLFFKGIRLLSLEYLKAFFDSRENVQSLLEIFKNLRESEQRAVLGTYILPFLCNQFDQQLSTDQMNPTTYSAFLALFTKSSPNTLLLPLIKFAESPSVSILVQRIIILVVAQYHKQSGELFTALLGRWSALLEIRHSPILAQKAQTLLLFLWVSQLPSSFLQGVSVSATYLNGISNRLSALSEQPRLYGMAFAENLSSRVDNQVKPLKFGTMGKDLDSELAYWKEIGKIQDAPITGQDGGLVIDLYFKQLERNSTSNQRGTSKSDSATDWVLSEHTRPTNESNLPGRITELDSDDEEDDEFKPYPFDEDDSEDSDDDPTIARREHIRPPMYIRDLLEYLNDTSEQSVEKVQIGLQHASSLIKRKAQFGKELKLNATELASSLVALKLVSEDDDEESRALHDLRLEALGVLVACEPFSVPPHLAHLLAVGDYSIMQRMVILSSITLGAHYLSRGEIGNGQDEITTHSASKRLPQGLHEKFAISAASQDKALQPFNMKQLQDVTVEVQRELTQGTSEKAQEELAGNAKVLRISSTLQKQRQNNGKASSSSSINIYASVAAKSFFYPLLAQWMKLGNRMVGGAYNELFASHYIKTLALLVHSAYPTSKDLTEMSEELIRIVLSYRNVREVHIQESLFTAVLTVLFVSPGELIASKWAHQVCVEIRLWLEDTWESVPDEKVRALGASALYQIQEIGQKWERRLIGEMISLESEGGRDIRIA